jgi:hypothetical protein
MNKISRLLIKAALDLESRYKKSAADTSDIDDAIAALHSAQGTNPYDVLSLLAGGTALAGAGGSALYDIMQSRYGPVFSPQTFLQLAGPIEAARKKFDPKRRDLQRQGKNDRGMPNTAAIRAIRDAVEPVPRAVESAIAEKFLGPYPKWLEKIVKPETIANSEILRRGAKPTAAIGLVLSLLANRLAEWRRHSLTRHALKDLIS